MSPAKRRLQSCQCPGIALQEIGVDYAQGYYIGEPQPLYLPPMISRIRPYRWPIAIDAGIFRKKKAWQTSSHLSGGP
jgi:hypothetical protein